MPTITLTRNLDSETLHLPELRSLVGHRVEIVVRDSDPSPQYDAARADAFQSLREAFEQSRQRGSNVDGEEAASEQTYEIARRLLEALPHDAPLPSVSAEPDGQLNFEWYQSPRRLLSVSVSESGTLYWAALIGTEDPRGSCQFAGPFPQTLLYWIGQVFA